jgi:acetoin utilization deacetylase AcuC-like enzyme
MRCATHDPDDSRSFEFTQTRHTKLMLTAFFLQDDHHAHAQPGHPERPERLDAVRNRLQDDAAWEKLQHLDPAPADLETAFLAHDEAYLEHLRETTKRDHSRLDADTYATAESLHVARRALGGLLAVTDAVLAGDAESGFAALRPPGHHATPDTAMGFCLLNHVAVAARHAQTEHDLERVLVVDFDVHHGNGTQDIFYDDPDVLYASTHQHPLFPGTGRAGETGAGGGEGVTVNVPLPPGAGDDACRSAFREMLRPVARRFDPELVLVSAGFDAHHADAIAQMNLSLAGFADLVGEVQRWADDCCEGRLVGTLEGGYHTGVLACGVTNTARRLHDPNAEIEDPFGEADASEPDASELLNDVAARHGIH